MVRELEGSSTFGLHRIAWDLRESPLPDAPARRAANPTPPTSTAPFSQLLPGVAGQESEAVGREPAGRGGGRGGRGAMVKPGTYTVTLGKLTSGVFIPMGPPQKVEVVPLEASNR